MGLLSVLAPFSGFSLDHEKDRKPPNILLILVDDLKPALGAYGDTIAITRHLDQPASTEIRFEVAYSNQVVCAPSLMNFMLGSRSTSPEIYNFGQTFRDYFPNALKMPQFFKQHGYHTESMAKVYHIGHNTYGDDASWSLPHHNVIDDSRLVAKR